MLVGLNNILFFPTIHIMYKHLLGHIMKDFFRQFTRYMFEVFFFASLLTIAFLYRSEKRENSCKK